MRGGNEITTGYSSISSPGPRPTTHTPESPPDGESQPFPLQTFLTYCYQC